jgi:hypothetical protein
MSSFIFRFGHLTAGEHEYVAKSAELARQVRSLVDELYEADDGHYQVYFRNTAGESLTLGQSGLMIYSPAHSFQQYFHLPDSRESVYEISTDFVTGNMSWWSDQFQPDSAPSISRTALFAQAMRGSVDYPLHHAALDNDLAAVKALIGAGRDVNSLDNKRRTPLVLAASQGHVKVCRYLVEHGADTHAKDDWGNSIVGLADEYPELLVYFKTLGLE